MTVTIGLDLSLTSTGIAVFKDGKYVEYANIKSAGKKGDGYPEFQKRIAKLYAETAMVLDDLAITHGEFDLGVIEAPSHGSKFGNPHERAGYWWKVYDLFVNVGCPVATVAPTTRAKYITGSGKADKKTVVAHANHSYVSEGTPRIPNDDVADACGMGAMASRYLGVPAELFGITSPQLDSMEVVKWPTI